MRHFLDTMRFKLRCLAGFAAGAVASFAMPPFGWWPLMFLGLSLFYVLLAPVKGWRAWMLGWMFGCGYFIVGLYWIGNALLVPGNSFKWVWPLAIVGLQSGLAIFTAVGAGIAAKAADLRAWRGYVAFCLCLVSVEWLRGHILTGFPWNLYAYTWSGYLPMVQSVSVIGAYGLTLLTILWGSLPGYLYVIRARRKVIGGAALAVVASMAVLYGFGWERLANNPTHFRDDVIVRVVQPDIAQDEKWSAQKVVDNLHRIVEASQGGFIPGKTYVMVWPETAIADTVVENPNAAIFIRALLFPKGERRFLITGELRHMIAADGTPRYFNSLVTYNHDLEAQGAPYDKSHLVPFGEYIPFNDILPLHPFVKFSGFTPGKGIMTQHVGGVPPFSGLICYEVLFPGAVALNSPRPEWMVNVTNDGWYGDSPGPYQHLAIAQYRAAEEGLPMARSANTGISAFIDPYGRILDKIAYNVEGHVDVALPFATAEATFYGRYKDLTLLIAIVFMALLVVAGKPRWLAED